MRSTHITPIVLLVLSLFAACAMAGAEPLKAAVSAYINTKDKEPFTCYDGVAGKVVEMKNLDVYPAEDYDLHLDLHWVSEKRMTPSDEILLTFRELFSGNTVECTKNLTTGWPVDNVRTGMLTEVHVTPEDVYLGPGFYHVRVDLEQNGQRLTQSHPGSVYFYLAAENESLRFITASYWVGHLSFLLDPETNAVVGTWAPGAPIPSSWDPFDASTRELWLAAHQAVAAPNLYRHQLRNQRGSAELFGDGGQGLLFAWYAYHAMGHGDRANFTRDLFNRACCDRLFRDEMVMADHYALIGWLHQAVRPITQACILFHDDPVYGEWAEKTFADLRDWMQEPYNVIKMSHYCVKGEYGGHTGRVFSSKSSFQLAHRLFRGGFYYDHTFTDTFQDLLAYAVDEANFLIENNGHYLDPALEDFWEKMANINMMNSFSTMLHLARETGHKEEAELFAKTLRELVDTTSSLESRPSGWQRGDAWLICEKILRLLGDNPVAAAYRDDCITPGDFMPAAEQRYNQLTVLMFNSPEWKRVVDSGKDWQLLPELPRPEPISWNENFEEIGTGNPPKASIICTSGLPETLAVTDETAASGAHSLKFIDGSNEQPYFEPELIYDLHFTEGTAVLSFDVRLEADAVFRSDLRDERSIDGVGPSVVFEQGKLRVGDRELMEVPEGQWFHVEIEAPLGGDGGKFDIAITLPGQAAKRFDDLPFHHPGVFVAHRCFLSSYGTEEGSFFLDNIRIEERL